MRVGPGVVDQNVGAAHCVVDDFGDGIGAGVGTQVSDGDDRFAAGGGDLRGDAFGLGLRRPWTTTVTPSAASDLAIASPMPLLLPVTRARFPLVEGPSLLSFPNR